MSDNTLTMDKAIAEIQASYDAKLKRETKKLAKSARLPFDGETYSSIITDGRMYVEGWRGDLTINKLSFGAYHPRSEKTMYNFIEPIVLPDTSFYGAVDRASLSVVAYYTNAKVAFHGAYKACNLTPDIHTGCFYNLRLKTGVISFNELKEQCASIAKMLETVSVLTIHGEDIICPEDSEYADVIKFIKQHERGITPKTKGFDAFFRPII